MPIITAQDFRARSKKSFLLSLSLGLLSLSQQPQSAKRAGGWARTFSASQTLPSAEPALKLDSDFQPVPPAVPNNLAALPQVSRNGSANLHQAPRIPPCVLRDSDGKGGVRGAWRECWKLHVWRAEGLAVASIRVSYVHPCAALRRMSSKAALMSPAARNRGLFRRAKRSAAFATAPCDGVRAQMCRAPDSESGLWSRCSLIFALRWIKVVPFVETLIYKSFSSFH